MAAKGPGQKVDEMGSTPLILNGSMMVRMAYRGERLKGVSRITAS
jgi:hypothetical protein